MKMKIIKQFHEIMTPINGVEIIKFLELCGRVCYKSEDKITEDSAQKMIRALLKSGHHSVVEHFNVTVRFITDRGVTHELVRHRLIAASQESTRFCNYAKGKYGKELTIVQTVFWSEGTIGYQIWFAAIREAEQAYLKLIEVEASPQEARSVLPNSLKTEIITTANLREWRHIFSLRAVGTSGKPHPQMQQLMLPLLKEMKESIPVMFDDLYEKAVEKGLY